MKKLAVFIAILLSNIIWACGFYPYGESVRFCFLNPAHFPYGNYASFNYSSLGFSQNDAAAPSGEENEKLWNQYCGGNIDLNDINKVLDQYTYSDIKPDPRNTFLTYLHNQKDTEAIEYLKFAKNCEYFNTWQDDPWERNESTVTVKRNNLLQKAISLAGKTVNKDIRKRYAFLALRLAYYQKDFNIINTVYSRYFNVNKTENIVDIWALYFKAIAEENKALANVYFAKVFVKCPEKRFVTWQYFYSKISEKEVLKYAGNASDRAAVLLLYGIYNPERNLENLKKIYAEDKKNEGLGFLLLREMSKLEDWIFTPYYTLFDPSTRELSYWNGDVSESKSVQQVLERSETDREYAQKVLDFIKTVDFSKVKTPEVWTVAKAELLLMTRNYSGSINEIAKLKKILPSESPIHNDLDKLKVLNIFAAQEYGNAVIPEMTKGIILKNKTDKQFIFALGRELEYLGNTDDAALLYVSLEGSSRDWSSVFYKSVKNRNKTYGDFFSDYFDYFDAVYTPAQLKSFINKAQNLSTTGDSFYRNYHQLKPAQINMLYDLLGTKYIRENELQSALDIFSQLGEGYFDAQYNLWQREGKEYDTWAGKVFYRNPFYHLKYTPDFMEEKEKIKLSKITITQKLIEYIRRADDPKEKDQDYYYFLVANCYYNMTQYGNAWMMKRYALSSSGNFSIRDDNEEFNAVNKAKFYYGKALANAKTQKFKALCLRMQGRCENYRLDYEQDKNVDYLVQSDNYEEARLQKNRYYKDLEHHYKDEYSDLMSGCDFFTSYFKARR
ncbi:hypothetical protein [Chryseobacterium herbae]|uniref:Tetratricopeptide repeat protein n=1 Tax=Chryseobacterium herbae TaxID=2976476 RepID=A0ABT2IRR1_9FLAO|nr:hypothetical protein [Chryseobacterium sp. pc1-10]MCT2561519.1 hypothetical protein [Chryseobacterium sp. pc1-10]